MVENEVLHSWIQRSVYLCICHFICLYWFSSHLSRCKVTAQRHIVIQASVREAGSWVRQPVRGLICLNGLVALAFILSARRVLSWFLPGNWLWSADMRFKFEIRKHIKYSQRLRGMLNPERHSLRRSAPQSEGRIDWEEKEERRGRGFLMMAASRSIHLSSQVCKNSPKMRKT